MIPRAAPFRRAFTLVELVMVVAIMGFIAAIAVPRFSAATQQANLRQLHANTSVLQRAIDRYVAEHGGLTPAHATDGSIDDASKTFKLRLLGKTDADGGLNDEGEFGPYLQSFPTNPFARGNVVRIDSAGKVAQTAWYFSSELYTIRADHVAFESVDLFLGGKGGKLVEQRVDDAAAAALVDVGAALD